MSTGTGTAGKGGASSAGPTEPVYSRCLRLPTGILTNETLGGFFLTPEFDRAAIDAATGFSVCQRLDGQAPDQFLTGPPVPDVGAVVAAAQQQLVLDVPEVATSPPRGGTQLVGVPVWFWVDDAEPTATTATVPGLAATLTATPWTTHVSISGGSGPSTADDVSFDCPGGGTPWVAGRHGERERSDCSHAFDWHGTHTVDVTVDWALTWTATNGQSGTLPAASRTTTFTLRIEEAQAVTD